MESSSEAKSTRLLTIYSRLVNGESLGKAELAAQYHVSDRSIQRDIESLRCFIAEQSLAQEILFDYRTREYRLVNRFPKGLSNSEILAVCKILLESRSMRRDEMMPILDKLLDCCVPTEQRKVVSALVSNERHHYIAPHHNRPILKGLWELGQAVQHQNVLKLRYEKLGSAELVERIVEPVGLMFSEYYFYLVAFIQDIDRKALFKNPDDLFPTIYRIDRIRSFEVLEKHFHIPYKDRFEEGEFRKRVQFMYGGRLQKIKFRYSGPSVEAVLDRLPTAQVLDRDEDGWTVTAEVFGKGIDMWIRSQGPFVTILSENTSHQKEGT